MIITWHKTRGVRPLCVTARRAKRQQSGGLEPDPVHIDPRALSLPPSCVREKSPLLGEHPSMFCGGGCEQRVIGEAGAGPWRLEQPHYLLRVPSHSSCSG